jgi:DNA-binding NarL/FixJ family response regulator
MPRIEATSPFAEQQIPSAGILIGDAFEQYQHLLPAEEEAIVGLRCIGWSWKAIADSLHISIYRVKQIERAGVYRMLYLYKSGR